MKLLRKLSFSYHFNRLAVMSVARVPYETQIMFIEALKCNLSLWQVATNLEEELSEADKAKMEFYAKRNKQIHAILAAPTEKLQKLRSNWLRTFLDLRGI